MRKTALLLTGVLMLIAAACDARACCGRLCWWRPAPTPAPIRVDGDWRGKTITVRGNVFLPGPAAFEPPRAVCIPLHTLVMRPAYVIYPVAYAPAGGPVIAQRGPVIAPAPSGGDVLSLVNAFRAAHGRPPAVWSASLAAAAATNRGTHDGTSSGGGMQVWSGARDFRQAVASWVASPAHSAILLSGTTIGVSASATGLTANVR